MVTVFIKSAPDIGVTIDLTIFQSTTRCRCFFNVRNCDSTSV